jgi:hypothetical protein
MIWPAFARPATQIKRALATDDGCPIDLKKDYSEPALRPAGREGVGMLATSLLLQRERANPFARRDRVIVR